MTDSNKSGQPALANLVNAGQQQTAPEKINDFIYGLKDISNLYLVKTGKGDVLINAGFMATAERNKDLLEQVRSGPLQAIFLTQAHADHFGGVPVLRDADTKVITQQAFTDTADYFEELMPYLKGRSGKLWASTIKGRDNPVPDIKPDIVFEERYQTEFGGRHFEAIATPGGEALDAMSVYLPDDKVLFTGNLFGPVFMSVPNFNTVRGDKPRLVARFLDSLNTVRKLDVELLITGHGDPISGKAEISRSLNKLYDAVSYIYNETKKGMNAGKSVHTLMREVQLPEELKLGEFHGKVSWAVKAIWHELSGWFMYESTTELYGVPRSSVHEELAKLAGVDALTKSAERFLDDGQPLQALHLMDIALDAEPDHSAAKSAKKRALEILLKESGGNNLSEVMWLRSEVASLD